MQSIRILSFICLIFFSLTLNAGEIHKAVFANNPDKIKLAVQHGDKINATNKDGMWPLLIACTFGYVESVKTLIELGADVNYANNAGYTALHEASNMGYDKIVKLLLDAGADVNKRDINHYNALNYAQMNDARKVIRILKRYKAEE